MLYRLIVMTGPGAGDRYTIDPAPMTIGRGDACDIRVHDGEVDTRHAVIEHRPEGIFIRDLGTIGRLIVNRREVRECRLRHGDSVEIGRTRFLVQAVYPAEAETDRDRRRHPRRAQLAVAVALLAASLGAGAWWFRRAPETTPAPPAPDRATLPPSPAPAAKAPVPAPPAEATPAPQEVASESAPAPVAPAPEPSTVAAAAPAVEPAAVSAAAPSLPAAAPPPEELKLVREDLARLHEMVRDLTERPPAVAPAAAAAAPAPATPAPPTVSPEELRQREYARVLAEARKHAEAGRVTEADQLLSSLQILEPGYVAAHEARAALFEQRGLIPQALDQWAKVLQLDIDAATQQRAVAERSRLADLERAAGVRATPVVKLAGVEQQRFPASDDYEEMRVLTISLQAEAPGEVLDPQAVAVEVVFFAQDAAEGSAPTAVRREPLRPEGPWTSGEPRTLTTTYVVPKASPEGAARPPHYAGYLVSLYYDGVLLEEDARPRTLLGQAPRRTPVVADRSSAPSARASDASSPSTD